MTAVATCRTCGTEPRAGARFCDACGAPTAASQPPAEYKLVTVLFADVVGSMDIAAAVGSERLREIMADLLDRSSAVVKRYGGTVNRYRSHRDRFRKMANELGFEGHMAWAEAMP